MPLGDLRIGDARGDTGAPGATTRDSNLNPAGGTIPSDQQQQRRR